MIFETILRSKNALLTTLESRTPRPGIPIFWGYRFYMSLPPATSSLLLDLAGIPRRSAQRRRDDPLVIAGGPVTFNVEPMAPFFDAVALGDGEELFPDVIKAHERWRGDERAERSPSGGCWRRLTGFTSRAATLSNTSPTAEVKRFHHVSGHQEPVLARVLEDLNDSPHPHAARHPLHPGGCTTG